MGKISHPQQPVLDKRGLQYDELGLAGGVPGALPEVVGGGNLGGRGRRISVEGAGGRDLQLGVANLFSALFETGANVLRWCNTIDIKVLGRCLGTS